MTTEREKQLTITSVPNKDAPLWSSGLTLQGTKPALALLCPFIMSHIQASVPLKWASNLQEFPFTGHPLPPTSTVHLNLSG